MAALPENDRIAGPFIAVAGQTDVPADFPLIRIEGLRLRVERNGIGLPVETYPAVDAVDVTADGFTARRATPFVAGDRIWVYSELPPVRDRQHTPNGAVRSATLEADAVEAQAQLQEARRDLGQAIRVAPGETPPDPRDVVPSLLKANKTGDNLAEGEAAAFRDVLKLGPTDDVTHQSVSGERFVAAGGLGRFGGSNDPGGIILGRGDPRSGPTDGAKIGPDGHGNWVHVETTRIGNPTELIVYSKALSGRAQGLNGTNVIERLEGDDVTPIAVGDTIYFAGRKLKVTGKPAYGRLAVSLYPSGSITFDTTFANEFYKWCYTTGDGVANIVGGQVKYVSGTPFPPLFFSDFSFTVNGVTYTASQLVFVDQATYGFTGTPPGNASNVAFAWRGNINDQVTTLRLQLEQGINEENLNVFAFAGHPTLGRGFYMTQDWAGLGKNRPFYIGSDDWSPGDPKVSIGVYPSLSQHDDAANRKVIPDGGDFVTLGGHAGNEALRVLNSPTKVSGVNRWDVAGAPTGFYPSLRVRGLDANIDLGLDAKGSGGLRVTQDFMRPVLHANAPPGLTAYPEINGGEGVVYVVAKPHGAGVTVADLALTGSGGLGRVRIGAFVAGAITPNGSIEIRTLAGETFLISGQKL